MSKLNLTESTLKTWLINLKKLKNKFCLLLVLAAGCLTLTAAASYNVVDNARILDKQTVQLVNGKNGRYLQTKEQPQIIVQTFNRVDKLTPKNLSKTKRRVFIVVGIKGKKHNVQIYSSKDLHSSFTADTRASIIRSEADNLLSGNKTTFNKGLRFVFRACATTIDKQYQYALDKYDLTPQEQDKVNHPNRVALPIAFALAILVTGLVYFFKKKQK